MKKQILLLLLCWSAWWFTGCAGKEEPVIYSMEEHTSAEEMRESETPDLFGVETEAGGNIYVYICGAVEHPGVVEVPSGTRLFEALEKAGGLTKEASEISVNQAEVLSDGQQVVILTEEEAEGRVQAIQAAALGQDTAAGAESQVNINTAAAEELMTLPGIGQAKAADIIHYRETTGYFQKIEDIMNVSGIKNAVFDKIRDKIVV